MTKKGKIHLGIVVSDFNSELTSQMLKAAEIYAKSLNANIVSTIHVPGAFDMPLAIQKLLKQKNIDAVVVLGVVVKGVTKHDEVIVFNLGKTIMDLALKFEKPIGFGVMGPSISFVQAEERKESYAKRAVSAAVELVRNLC